MAVLMSTTKLGLYDVTFHEDHITTTVTKTAAVVDKWLAEILNIHRHYLDKLFIGLDTEWVPVFQKNVHQPVAILQLCIGHRCLIFKLLHATNIPDSLVSFLGNEKFTFVGVGIKTDAEKLFEDCGLKVGRTLDLAGLAASRYGDDEFKRMGLKRLVREVLGKDMEKPKNITLSKWNASFLTPAQIQYACIDAFVSFQLGIRLYKHKKC